MSWETGIVILVLLFWLNKKFNGLEKKIDKGA